MFAPDGALLIEQCIDAISEHSVEVIFHDGKASVIAIGDKVKSPAPYRVDLEVRYPTSLAPDDAVEVRKTAIRAAEALGIAHGMAHVELARTQHGPMLFELGARCGGGATAEPLVHFVTGVDEFADACRVACGMRPQLSFSGEQRGGCYRFLTPKAGSIVSHEMLEDVRTMPGVLLADIWAVEGSIATTVRTGRDRAGAVVTGAESRAAAIQIADEAAAMLELRRAVVSR
jgi:biotin carboxylase